MERKQNRRQGEEEEFLPIELDRVLLPIELGWLEQCHSRDVAPTLLPLPSVLLEATHFTVPHGRTNPEWELRF